MLNNQDTTNIWTINQILDALNICSSIEKNFNINGIAIDSRNVKAGNLFIAIKGERLDGHDFIEQAFLNGATHVLVNNSYITSPEFDHKFIKVNDTFIALYDLARYARKRFKGKVIAITGSVGKTTTKEMLKLLLEKHCSQSSSVYASFGNYNNHYGTPLCLVNMPVFSKYAIFELGMTGFGEISTLSKLCSPHISIITAIEAVHLEFFSSISQIAEAKSEIFEGMDENGIAIINMDTPYTNLLRDRAKKLKVITFGENHKADIHITNHKIKNAISYISIDVKHGDVNNIIHLHYSINHPGKHIAINSLGVIGVLKECLLEENYMIDTESEVISTLDLSILSNFSSITGRGQVLHNINKKIKIIDESYNASPIAMSAAISSINAYKEDNQKSRIIAILGDMKELGKESIYMHEFLLQSILKSKIGKVITVGYYMKSLFNILPKDYKSEYFKSSSDLLPYLDLLIDENDIVLIKGSLSMNMKQIVDKLMS